ncbi:nucleotide pyrophosphohydrolase [Magnetovibrio sp. PR-2]|uniref:nucleotide pyrophosphohydrolase n=1 Tax=Magnetovibrio sp. PR-2 TaxID=3120356 RepID=UPI002FCDF8E1
MSQLINDLTERLIAFRDARDWRQFHSLKDLIASASIEAGELLELTQWKDAAELEAKVDDPDFRARLSEEVSDVFLYLLLISERAGIDLVTEAHKKIVKNDEKYPVEKAKGNARKYTEL